MGVGAMQLIAKSLVSEIELGGIEPLYDVAFPDWMMMKLRSNQDMPHHEVLNIHTQVFTGHLYHTYDVSALGQWAQGKAR